eukprot:gene15598-biopygen9726
MHRVQQLRRVALGKLCDLLGVASSHGFHRLRVWLRKALSMHVSTVSKHISHGISRGSIWFEIRNGSAVAKAVATVLKAPKAPRQIVMCGYFGVGAASSSAIPHT